MVQDEMAVANMIYISERSPSTCSSISTMTMLPLRPTEMDFITEKISYPRSATVATSEAGVYNPDKDKYRVLVQVFSPEVRQ